MKEQMKKDEDDALKDYCLEKIREEVHGKPRKKRMLRKQVEIFSADNFSNLQKLINQFLENILPEDVLNITIYFDRISVNIIYLKDVNDA